jgi:hypothetical protein
MVDWSSLPVDLINRIADCILSTDDIDYYMDLSAVCSGWRSSTADPKSSPRDPRFRPRQWAMLDEVYQSGTRLFVNVATGRFVRKDLPLLCMCDVVTGAGGGLVVLAERTAPYAARVLNPFMGAMISFDAPVPCLYESAAHVIGSLPTLVLTSNAFGMIYWADPDSKSFTEDNDALHILWSGCLSNLASTLLHGRVYPWSRSRFLYYRNPGLCRVLFVGHSAKSCSR